MDHPEAYIGEAFIPFHWEDRFVSLDSRLQRELKILNCRISFKGILDKSSAIKYRIKEIGCYAPETAGYLLELAGQDLICLVKVHASWEQEPLSENRIELSSIKKDIFGMPRTVLYYKKSRRDLLTVRKTIEHIATYRIAKSLAGRIKLKDYVLEKGDYPSDDVSGEHHIGGTRMSEHSSKGVVDAHNKMQNLDNFYIAGSSVFPSGGHANSTLTIVQLSLRLGEHLKKIL